MNWIDKHSVNCFICNNLVDERECVPGFGGEGDICPKCLTRMETAPEMLESIEDLWKEVEQNSKGSVPIGIALAMLKCKDAMNKARGE